jgi:hypothetical protein
MQQECPPFVSLGQCKLQLLSFPSVLTQLCKVSTVICIFREAIYKKVSTVIYMFREAIF